MGACATLAAPPVEVSNRVVIEHGSLAIDHTQSLAQITQAQAKGGFRAQTTNIARPMSIGLGLYQSRMTTTLEIKASGGAYARIALTTRVKTEPVIYVAKEFPKDSCAYKLVLGHEYQHYLFDRDVLRAMPDEAQAIARDVFGALSPDNAAALEAAKAVYFQRFNSAFEGRSFPLHARIDSPESYANLAELCHREIPRQLGEKQGAPAVVR